MNCFFHGGPCGYINCWLWNERRQACRVSLAIDRYLGEDVERPVELTPTQQKILNLVVQGRSNKQIAMALNVCPGTVKNHVSIIFRKLGVHSRTELVILSLKNN